MLKVVDSILVFFLIAQIVFIAAAIALLDVPGMDAEKILRKSMKIAGDFCVYTNHNLTIESISPATAAVVTPKPFVG